MNADLSAAPEIARLAAPHLPAQLGIDAPRTVGRVAADLAGLAATPERWWDLVRFHPASPLLIPVPGAPSTWLLVLPPGSAADCDCRQDTTLAGDAVEAAADGEPARSLRPGRVHVHGQRSTHRHLAAGPGYSVTLHCS